MSSTSLFLCHRLPFPPNKGDKIRSFALLKHLAKLGPVSVGCFVDDPLDMRYVDDVRALAGGDCRFIALSATAKWNRAALALASGQPITTSYFGNKALMRWVLDIAENKPIDNWVVFGSAMAPYLMCQPCNGSRVLFDMVDVDSDKWRQYAAASSGVLKWVFTREANSLEALERKAAAHFGMTLLVSPFEARTFQSLAPESKDKITSLANGVDLEFFTSGRFSNPFRDDERAIVMTGRMDYRPNYEGAIWFSEKVAPSIFAQLPAAKVYFVGSNPPSSLRRVVGPRVSVTGSVDDVRPYLQYAAAVVAPLQMARGLQNKVLEAMAMAKPIVATREATRALDVKNGTHLWIENEPERFAAAVVKAVEGPDRAAVMRNARTFVEHNHSWERILSDFDKHLEQLKGKTDLYSSAGATPRTVRRPITDWDHNSNRAEA